MQNWAARNGVELHFIQPGKPVQNAYIENFNSCFCEECLSQRWFASLSHMRSIIDNWREDYNHHRPHSTRGYMPPAVFAARCHQHAGGNAQNPASPTTTQSPGLWIEVLRNLGAAHELGSWTFIVAYWPQLSGNAIERDIPAQGALVHTPEPGVAAAASKETITMTRLRALY